MSYVNNHPFKNNYAKQAQVDGFDHCSSVRVKITLGRYKAIKLLDL